MMVVVIMIVMMALAMMVLMMSLAMMMSLALIYPCVQFLEFWKWIGIGGGALVFFLVLAIGFYCYTK
jgi:hypothetical protein